MSTNCPPPAETFEALAELQALTRRSYQHELKAAQLGISPISAQVLRLIARNPSWTQQRLAEAIGREKAQLTRVMRELEAQRLIRRHASGADRRAKAARLTPEGTAALRDLEAMRGRLAERILQPLSEAEQSHLADLIGRLVSGLAPQGGPS